MRDLTTASTGESLPAEMQAEVAQAVHYAKQEKSENTRRAYARDLVTFRDWCESRGVSAMPADQATVAAFLSSQADSGLAVSTITRRAAAIRYAHSVAGLEPPTNAESVKAVIRGIRRAHGVAPQQKAPATSERILKMLEHIPEGSRGLRDRALLLLGFAGAFRRSELVALNAEDIEETAEGLRVTIRRSKTDQEGAGQVVAIVRGSQACPVAALVAWLNAANVEEGPLFRPITKGGTIQPRALTCRSVANIIKDYAERAGFNPADFAGHSLRSGFLTSAAGNGASVFKMLDVSRHRSVNTLRGYVRRAEEFKDHAGAGLL